MSLYPLFLDLHQKKCLIVGGGKIAFQKAKRLYQAGVILTVVAPEILPEIKTLDDQTHRLFLVKRCYDLCDLEDQFLVIAATDDPLINQQIYHQASQTNCLVNVVDQPNFCSAVVPSVIDRSPLLIAISSSTKAPMLSAGIRKHLLQQLPKTYTQLIEVVDTLRPLVQKMRLDETKKRFWQYLLDDQLDQLLNYQTHQAMLAHANTCLKQFNNRQHHTGSVSIVGAGPGDPELLTLKACRLMRRADVLLHDQLIGQGVLEFVRRDAQLVAVGKRGYGKSVPQSVICDLMVEHYQAGKHVVRLKGGDPFVFGRGGEEITHLADHSIPFSIVPGVSAANGCASYANIPLTHRDCAHSVEFLTLHGDGSGKLAYQVPWEKVIDPFKTLVFFMGKASLDICIKNLKDHGMPLDTPMAFIVKGTTADQQIYKTQLKKAEAWVGNIRLQSPLLIIVGRVVSCVQ